MRAHIVASSGSLVLVDWPALAECCRSCSCDSRSITLAGIWRQINLSYSYVSKCIKHSSYWKLRLHRRALKLARLTQNQLHLCARHAGDTGNERIDGLLGMATKGVGRAMDQSDSLHAIREVGWRERCKFEETAGTTTEKRREEAGALCGMLDETTEATHWRCRWRFLEEIM